MKKDLEKLWESYFPFEHQKCSDECTHKSMEIINQQDFIKEVKSIFIKYLIYFLPEAELYDLKESRGHDYDEGWNDCREEMSQKITKEIIKKS